jgi:hypothetical protein
MIESDWYAFEQPDLVQTSEFTLDDPPSAEVMAATLATARYFTPYLQEKGHLKAVYTALQRQKPDNISDARGAALSTVEQVLGASLAEIDRDFVNWFEHQSEPH